jgi:hypothetical protein
MKSFLVGLGTVVILASLVLFGLVVAHIPAGFWDPQTAEVRWYKIDGFENVNGKLQFKFAQVGNSDELNRLAITADPEFFTGAPVNVMIRLPEYKNGSKLAPVLISRMSAGEAGSLLFKAVPQSPRSPKGYLGAIAGVVIGLLLIVIGLRSKPEKRVPIQT